MGFRLVVNPLLLCPWRSVIFYFRIRIMIIKEKIGNLNTFDDKGRGIDRLPIEWFETNKRILHKTTISGKEVILKILKEGQILKQDDVVFANESFLIVVEILTCDAIIITPKSTYEMACICYEIGNKHLPLFYEDKFLLIPFDAPVYRMLEAGGYNIKREERKLLHQLKTTVSPHEHASSGESLFSKILKLTTAHPHE
jgi:urease accessory protein